MAKRVLWHQQETSRCALGGCVLSQVTTENQLGTRQPTSVGDQRVSGINVTRNVLVLIEMISHQKNVANVLGFHIILCYQNK